MVSWLSVIPVENILLTNQMGFIGFTGMPIEQHDSNTRAVVDDYVSVFDIQQAAIDTAVAPAYDEGRIATLAPFQ